MNVASALDRWASEQPNQPAIVASRGTVDGAMTYGQLREASSRLAGVLESKHVRPGDHVAILATLSIDLYVALIAVLWSGAVPVIVDPSVGLRRARACFRKARVRALVGSRAMMLFARALPELRTQPAIHVRSRGRHADIVDVPTSAPALLTFTSGSTGTPSAVVRSHGLLIAQNAALQSVLMQEPGQRWLSTLPVFVLAHLAEGATAILADADLRRPGFIDGARLSKQAARCRADAVVASPSLLLRLVDASVGACSFGAVYTGGAPVFPTTIERLRTLSRNGEIVVVYGSTEAEPIAHVLSPPGDSFNRSLDGDGIPVGHPCDDVTVRLLRELSGELPSEMSREAFDDCCAPDGQPGEIIVTGDHVVKGYLDGEGDRFTKLRVGDGTDSAIWHRTGDAGRLDEEGLLWLLGRYRARVRRADGSVSYPFEVEVPVSERFGLRCALLPTDDAPILVVERRGLNAPDDILERIQEFIGNNILVKDILRIPLDHRHNAKIDYAELRQRLF